MQNISRQMNILLKKLIDKDKFSKCSGLVKKYIMKTQFPNKKEFLDALIGNYKTWKQEDLCSINYVKS